jgi:hypothetical protein
VGPSDRLRFISATEKRVGARLPAATPGYYC